MRVKCPLAASLAALLFAAGLTIRAAAPPVGSRPPGQQPAAQSAASSAGAQTSEQIFGLVDDVAKEVEALRGWTFKRPIKKQLTTVAEMRQYLEQQADNTVASRRVPLTQALLRTIGLIPATCDLKATSMALLENQVLGFYVPETKTMHLVARADLPASIERIMLAHELTHALDDQYVDLEAITKSRQAATEDLDLALEAVGEGSATALMLQYASRAVVSGKMDIGALQQYAQEEARKSQPFLDAPRYFSAMLGAYICGTQFLARGQLIALMLAPDDRAIGAALVAVSKDLPQSTEQVLHPDKYWDPAKRDDPVLFDDAAASRWLAQPGRWVVHADTIGEMLTSILTTPAAAARPAVGALQSSEAWTNAAAEGWGGDRFYLLADGATAEAARAGLNNPRGAWISAWDTAADREEFLAALPKGSLAPGAAADAIGERVAVVYFGLDEATRARLTGRLRESPLPMTKDGKAWPPPQ